MLALRPFLISGRRFIVPANRGKNVDCSRPSTVALPVPCRAMTTPSPQVNASDLSMERYHTLSEAVMDNLLESLENLLDDIGDPDYEVEYHSGVLTLRLGGKGTYVINKQPPNKQIWLSSPFSGPKRYDYLELEDQWRYSRDGLALTDLLNKELSDALGHAVCIRLPCSLRPRI